MEFQVAEAAKLIQQLAETENLTLSDALTAFVTEAELSVENASQLKSALFESYTLENMVSDSLTKALHKTFVAREAEDIHEVQTKETAEGTKYKVRVKDKNSGSSYTRYATRAKIAELRANPNISSVEMSDYGDTSEDRDGQKTAAAKGGGKGDGNLANNYPPYNKVTRGDIIAGARGRDQEGGKRKFSKEETELQEMPMSGTMSGNNMMNNAAEKMRMKQQEREQKKLERMEKQQQQMDMKNAAGDGMTMKRDIMASTESKGSSLFEKYKEMRKAKKEDMREGYKGKHGQSDKEYADSRSQGGKMVSGDSKMSGAEYTHGRRVKAENPGMQPDVGGKTKPKSQGKMDKGTRADLEYRKAKLKSEEYFMEADLVDAGKENEAQRNNTKLTGKGVDNSDVVKLMPKLGEEVITEKAVSKAQQKFMGMVYATKKGDMKDPSAAVKKAADSMSTKEADKFASTKRKGLPDHKENIELDAAGMPVLKEYSRNNAEGPTVDMVKPPKDEEGEVGVKNPKGPRASRRKAAMGGDRRPGVGPGAGV